MPWTWKMEADVYVLRRREPLPGASDLGFRGRALTGNAPGPLAGRACVRLGQVHGARIATPAAPGVIEACDGARSRVPGLLLTVRTADCIPVVMTDPDSGVALVHAGWRGLAAGILEAAAATFPHPSRVHVVLGPSIGLCCYEVGSEVASRFPVEAVGAGSGPRPHLDLHRAAAIRLESAGVSLSRMESVSWCTRCHQHLLHSSRGSGGSPERIVAFLAA